MLKIPEMQEFSTNIWIRTFQELLKNQELRHNIFTIKSSEIECNITLQTLNRRGGKKKERNPSKTPIAKPKIDKSVKELGLYRRRWELES